MAGEAVIEFLDVVVGYDKRRVLDGLSFRVDAGETFGFLGPNGAGKSTTIKTLLGFLTPQSGTVRLHSLNPQNPRARALVGFLPEETTYHRYLTPVETLEFYGRLSGLSKSEVRAKIPKLLEKLGLEPVKNKLLKTFSKGMVQKVSLAQALLHEPRTLILDEPMSGLDPLARLELRETLRGLKEEGRTIFFSSHELSEVELLCDSVAILNQGRLILSGGLEDVLGARGDRQLERFFIETIQKGAVR
jgi:ABC-2 type transport system ATP-binding protein